MLVNDNWLNLIFRTGVWTQSWHVAIGVNPRSLVVSVGGGGGGGGRGGMTM